MANRNQQGQYHQGPSYHGNHQQQQTNHVNPWVQNGMMPQYRGQSGVPPGGRRPPPNNHPPPRLPQQNNGVNPYYNNQAQADRVPNSSYSASGGSQHQHPAYQNYSAYPSPQPQPQHSQYGQQMNSVNPWSQYTQPPTSYPSVPPPSAVAPPPTQGQGYNQYTMYPPPQSQSSVPPPQHNQGQGQSNIPYAPSASSQPYYQMQQQQSSSYYYNNMPSTVYPTGVPPPPLPPSQPPLPPLPASTNISKEYNMTKASEGDSSLNGSGSGSSRSRSRSKDRSEGRTSKCSGDRSGASGSSSSSSSASGREKRAASPPAPSQEKEEKEGKKAVPIMVGKRRGGRVLPTGVVKKPKVEEDNAKGKSDAWSQYMAEVRRYKDQSCTEERQNRPLVK